MDSDQPLRILHVVRAPVGGIFRHILDVANGQIERGHHVGIVTDSITGGERAATALAEIEPRLKLGVRRVAIRREPRFADAMVWAQIAGLIWKWKPDVLHGHGAKAGAYVRLRPHSKHTIRVYTPHGGSLHYPLDTLKGNFYSRLERALMNNTDLFLFESAFARDTYQRTVGTPTSGVVRCVFNGVTAEEFDPIDRTDDATDIVYVGEFRHIKGADLLIDAVAKLRAEGKPVTLTLAGDGEESEKLKAQVKQLALGDAARFIGHVKARYGFSNGKLLVVPSRGELDALCRDRGCGRGDPDGSRQCRRHPRDLRPAQGCAVCTEQCCCHGGSDQPRARRSRGDIGARNGAARAHLCAFLAKGDGRGRARRLSRRVCQSLTTSYPRNRLFRFLP